MNKYVSPIIEIENIEVERIMDMGFSDENDIPVTDPSVVPLPGQGGNNQLPIIPNNFSSQYFNKQ